MSKYRVPTTEPCPAARPDPYALLRTVHAIYELTEDEGPCKQLSGADLVEQLGWTMPAILEAIGQEEAEPDDHSSRKEDARAQAIEDDSAADEEYEVCRALVVSTAHLPNVYQGPGPECEAQGPAAIVQALEYGWRVYVGDSEPSPVDFGRLARTVEIARRLRCRWIEYDRDGPQLPELTSYDDRGNVIR